MTKLVLFVSVLSACSGNAAGLGFLPASDAAAVDAGADDEGRTRADTGRPLEQPDAQAADEQSDAFAPLPYCPTDNPMQKTPAGCPQSGQAVEVGTACMKPGPRIYECGAAMLCVCPAGDAGGCRCEWCH
jgi:hypothetical protein